MSFTPSSSATFGLFDNGTEDQFRVYIFKNIKIKDNHPDYKGGRFFFDGKRLQLAGWYNSPKSPKKPFIYLQITDNYEKVAEGKLWFNKYNPSNPNYPHLTGKLDFLDDSYSYDLSAWDNSKKDKTSNIAIKFELNNDTDDDYDDYSYQEEWSDYDTATEVFGYDGPDRGYGGGRFDLSDWLDANGY
jgi:hypothetical protein